MMFQKEQLALLRQFVSLCKQAPATLYAPELEFFRDWLKSMNAKLPDPPKAKQPEAAAMDDDEDIEEMSTPGASKNEQPAAAETPEEKEEELIESEESDIELEELDGLIKDEVKVIPEMGDDNIEVTPEMMEEANNKRGEAMSAMSDGNFDDAIKLITEAIKKNPKSANMYAKRAMFYVKFKKPSAAIIDCEKALSINKDSAQPYKWRGRAYRLLGKYEEAWHDFQTACRLDFDDTCNEWMREVQPNAKKISEHKRRYARKHEEFERKRKIREAERRRAQAKKEYEEAQKRQSSSAGGFPGGFPGGMPGGFPGGMPGGFPGGMGGMPGGMGGGMPGGMPGGMGGMPGGMGGMPGGMGGGMPGGAAGGGAGGMPDLSGLFKDPELMTAMQDPEVMAAFQDVSKNPANMDKYKDNPKVKRVIEKLQTKFGGAGPS